MSPTNTPRGGTLVVQPLPGLGDTIWHLPHLRAIAAAASDKTITLLTKERSRARELLSASDHIREVIYLAPDGGRHSGLLGGWRLGEDLRVHGFGEVWILHGSSRYAFAACRAGIPKRMGYGIGWQDALLTSPHGLSRRDQALSSIEKADRLLRLHDLPVIESGANLKLSKSARQAAESALASLPTPAIALAIGSSEAFKQWGVESFTALIRALKEEKDYSIVLVGGAAEAEAAERLVALFNNPSWLVALIDKPILEAAAAVSECQTCIGNDTGMLHIAAAVGTPSLGLFGGSTPLHQDPRIMALSPTGKVRYGKDRMAEISVEMVLDSFRRLETGQ